MERKKVCSVMDCKKLSREACGHATKNDRLPVQIVVQVLYHEQQRLREVVSGSLTGAESPAHPPKGDVYPTDIHPVPDELSRLKKENQELKFELIKMRTRLQEIDKPTDKSGLNSPSGSTGSSADKPRLSRKSFISSVSKKLGRLYPFLRADGATATPTKGRKKGSRDRRHSIS